MEHPYPKTETDGNLDPRFQWKLKDYGIGPEPLKGTPEWMEWIEDRAMLAATEPKEDKAKGQATRHLDNDTDTSEPLPDIAWDEPELVEGVYELLHVSFSRRMCCCRRPVRILS